ncbi:hypothetical protein K2173_016431 [Erythroxylum novogranatense]|uniref:DUF4228 domain protein n=1 Tax=Erythroxylum novogranatense TaxID=1862640 RepID=A0AAV8SGU7_9ROSI|nr:hypothetical protein K2173_016431 [Erythroxylum novogranatense]
MGNTVSPCCKQNCTSSVKLIFWEGTTRLLTGKHIAGEIMFENPEMMVCHADSFFIGHPVPALAIDDELMPGQTYFVLPIDRFACNVLSVSSIAALSPSPKPTPLNFSTCAPFEYINSENGRVVIKVVPEFITRLIHRGKEETTGSNSPCNEFLCSTPELKKQYGLLVRPKDQTWSPKLETITEYKIRRSPCRFIGLERKQKEK